ncbi:MAG: cytochrome o ubiquinol oxidase subunit III [Legionellales bacterium]|nr:cytochrome o ubiquinol oxidase subunit III [Legionellales bacterium]|tara:strand:+ start:8768 stop:9361 length:594 start_codon:yes stop_codon:yes gene_type:complete
MSAGALAHDHHHDSESTDVFGFWLYILTDCILFASLFATYLVLNHPDAYGPAFKEHVNLAYVLWETFLLLGSNFTFGLSVLSLNKGKLAMTQFWLVLTFILGAGFVGMEINEFVALAHEGFHWQASGAASAFFTLVGTHGLHVSFGLLWILITIFQLPIFKVSQIMKRRIIYLGLFWNFLDIVWIFLFSIVYLMGAV